MKDSYDVFISYSHVDGEWVHKWLLPHLASAGVSVCTDSDFDIGVPSITNMERAVETSRKTLLVITPDWVASEWTNFESLMVQTDDPAGRRARMLPLVLKKSDLPARIKILTYLDFTNQDEWEFQLARLITAIGGAPVASSPAPAAVLTALASQPNVAIDFSHKQKDDGYTGWNGYYQGVTNLMAGISGVSWKALMPGETLDASTLASYKALVLALPFATTLSDQEISGIRAWVQSGGGLLMLSAYTADIHHSSNLNALARALDFEFAENLILPPNPRPEEAARVQTFSSGNDRSLVVVTGPPGGPLGAHPIFEQVKQVGFLSACSLKNEDQVSDCIITTNSCVVLRPEGHKNPKGWIQQIVKWNVTDEKEALLLSARRVSKGKVVAIGAWKVVLTNLTEAPDLQNARLFQNIIHWLIG